MRVRMRVVISRWSHAYGSASLASIFLCARMRVVISTTRGTGDERFKPQDDLSKRRLLVIMCAHYNTYGAVVWCEWLSVLSVLMEPRTCCRCSASNFPLSMTPSSSCPYLCLFSRPCSSSVAVQP